jgi:zinc D-Ala-D-Ala carboxypeptidase
VKLSPSFDLSEFVLSQTATRMGLDNRPPAGVVADLQRLARTVLQPLRDHLGRAIVVSSGYRSPDVNRAIGGASNSAHMHGRAADIIAPGLPPREVCLMIVALDLPFDQVISEFGAWCHVAIAAPGVAPRRQQLTAVRGLTGTTYLRGIQ